MRGGLAAWAALLSILAGGCRAAADGGNRPRIFLTPETAVLLRQWWAGEGPAVQHWQPREALRQMLDRAKELAAKGPYSYTVVLPGRNGGPGKRWSYTLSDQPPPRHDDYRHYPPWTAMFQERYDSITTRIRLFCLAYIVTGQRQWFERAREIVMHLCRWPIIWTDPSYGSGRPCLDTGHAAQAVALFYDWCWRELSARDRATVRRALAEKALQPIYEALPSIPVYHNYSAVVATGLGIGALALMGEDERAEKWLQAAVQRMRATFDAQGSDGGPYEGPMYGTYMADNYARLLLALETAGRQVDIWDHVFLRTLTRYAIGLSAPGCWEVPTFGDGGPTKFCPLMMKVLARHGDGVAAWYLVMANLMQPRQLEELVALAGMNVQPCRPDFDPSLCFKDVGYASLRDGFNRDGTFIAFKAGPPKMVVGHNHFDQNSFQLCWRGRWLGWDPGYRSYFYPPARKYTTSAFGHNTIVLDLTDEWLRSPKYATPGVDQVRLNGGRIVRHYSGPGFAYVLGDAAAAYNPDGQVVLNTFLREIILAKPRLVIIRDRLAAPEAHRYYWMFHGPPDAVLRASEGGRFKCFDWWAALEGRIWATPRIQEARSGLYPGAEKRGPYLWFATERAKSAEIWAALRPGWHRELANAGFESGLEGWQIRRKPGYTENHGIDEAVVHSGRRAATIKGPGGYLYSVRLAAPPGAKVEASWWVKTEGSGRAFGRLYFWRNMQAVRGVKGPEATGQSDWRQFRMQATAPAGSEAVCLSLEFWGEGRAWFDDAALRVEAPAKPGLLECQFGDQWLRAVDADGEVVVVAAGLRARSVRVGRHRISLNGELAAVRFGPDGRPKAALLVHGRRLSVDGRRIFNFRLPQTASRSFKGRGR